MNRFDLVLPPKTATLTVKAVKGAEPLAGANGAELPNEQ